MAVVTVAGSQGERVDPPSVVRVLSAVEFGHERGCSCRSSW